jgi:mediator of RNA polymerase II transcription subunit 5
MSPSTPTPILQICAPFILRASIEKKPQKIMPIIEVLRKRASSVLGITPSPSTAGVSTAANTLQSATTPSGTQSRIAWVDLPGQAIRNALTMATSGRATFLDVPHCLLTTSPLRFLSLLWKELLRSAIMHGLSTSQRLAVFVLTAPRVRLSPAATTSGPLLPIFLQASLPRIIQDTDFQSSRELATELLVAILTSSLTAAYYLALPEDQVHGPGTLMDPAAWARSLLKHLQARRKDSATSLAILQRLSTTTLFCAHFPMFS